MCIAAPMVGSIFLMILNCDCYFLKLFLFSSVLSVFFSFAVQLLLLTRARVPSVSNCHNQLATQRSTRKINANANTRTNCWLKHVPLFNIIIHQPQLFAIHLV